MPVLFAFQIFAQLIDHALIFTLSFFHTLFLIEQDKLPVIVYETCSCCGRALGHVQPFSWQYSPRQRLSANGDRCWRFWGFREIEPAKRAISMLDGRGLGFILSVVHERGSIEERGATDTSVYRSKFFFHKVHLCLFVVVPHRRKRRVHQALTLVSITVAREVIRQSRCEIVQHERLLLWTID